MAIDEVRSRQPRDTPGETAPSRLTVLEQLAELSDAGEGRTTILDALSTALEANTVSVEARLNRLEDCELVRSDSNGRVRVTITGEELLGLDVDEMTIIDPESPECSH